MIDLAPFIAHRGASADAPENTLSAFRLAAEQGASWIECDAKLTKDDQIILFHDDDLDRTTNGKGKVASTTWSEIQALDAGSWLAPQWRGEKVPSFEAALQCWVECGLKVNIELKPCPGREQETAELVMRTLDRLWPQGRPLPLISSFSMASLRHARKIAPRFPIGLLLEDYPKDWRAMAREIGAYSLHCWDEKLTEEWAFQIKQAGFRLLVYTVNEPLLAKRLYGWGADSLFTDRPGFLRGLLSF